MPITFNLVQDGYRFYADDGNEAGSTALGTQDVALSLDVEVRTALHLRIRLTETTGSASGAATDDFQLQRAINGGTWEDVNAVNTGVQYSNSGNLTDSSATTERLTGATGLGAFQAGEVSEDGLVDDYQFLASNWSELLYSIAVNYSQVTNGDTITFRVLLNGSTLGGYSVTPTINISKAVVGRKRMAAVGNLIF